MQLNKNYPFKKPALLVMLMITMSAAAHAQCDAAYNHPKPYMWGPKNDTLLEHFRMFKKPVLDSVFKTGQTDSFFLGNFLGMMAFFESRYGAKYACLHIFICTYTNEGSAHVPKDSANKLTLVFAPARIKANRKRLKDLGYFTFPPGTAFNPANLATFKISKGVFKTWHRNFSRNMLGRLKRTINDRSEHNREGDRYTDTRAITYCREDLHELINEQCYTHATADGTRPVNITKDFIARFAAHGPAEAQLFPKRFFVLFDLVDDQRQIVQLEKTECFYNRKDARPICGDCQRRTGGQPGVNNGQLCPPSVNCPNYKAPVTP